MMLNNLDGQVLGKKGQATRERLLSATMTLLKTTALREVRAADVARTAGISPANFYLYFEKVEAIALALADRVADGAGELIDLVRADWTWQDENQKVLGFARAYFDFWDEHRPILRVRNLAADEGDWGFMQARARISVPLHDGMAAKIDKAKRLRRISSAQHSVTLASVALAGLERTASTYPTFPQKYGVTRERLIQSCVFSLKAIALGPAPD
jgi:AcrR family transcriptional regulator